jgi:AcrR family transcriptional regulator
MPRINAATVEEHKRITRLSLLEAAEALFSRLGYDGASHADIAAFAGIGRTTFYDYFDDKEDLLATLVEERLPGVLAEMIAAVPRNLPHRERLGALVVALVEFVVNEPVLGLTLHQDVSKLAPGAQVRIREAHRDLISELAVLYRGGVDEGSFRLLPTDLAGNLIQESVMAAAAVIIRSEDPKSRFHEVADEAASYVLKGLAV